MRYVVKFTGLVVVLGLAGCSSSDSGGGNTGGTAGTGSSTSTGGTAGMGGLSGAGGISGTGGGSSGLGGTGGADAGGTDGGVACGIIVYSDNAACQGWMDQYCCAAEQACGVSCRAIVACVNACPAPRTDTCIGACVPQSGGTALDEMDVIGNCSKFAPPPSGQSCPWPK